MSHTTHAHSHLSPGVLGHGQIPFSEPGTPGSHPSTIGFIGVGNIGAAIAKNLAVYSATHKADTHSFVIYNRTKAKAEKLVSEVEERLAANGGILSIKVADTVDEVVEQSDIIIASTNCDESSISLAKQIAELVKTAKPRIRIIVETSTLYPTTAGEIDSILTADHNTHFIAAPVFGAPQAAKEAKLILCLAGDYASKKKIAYLLVPAAARKCIDLGGNVEKAAAFKLLGNSFIVGTLELLAETHTFAEKIGVGSQAFHDLLGGTSATVRYCMSTKANEPLITDLFPAPPVAGYSKRILTDDFDASNGFQIDGGLKDVHHMQRLASEHQVPIPIIDIAQQHLVTAKALNASQPSYKVIQNQDWSSLVAASRVAAGLSPFDSSSHRTGPVLEPEPEEE
ncbi:hypothetical protein FRC01_000694 [Tulasnella sp. 417]|nr:hypothetical protein FRC01_000694 [Tulasnella sp. 417]